MVVVQAQLVVGELYHCFHLSSPLRFNFADAAFLTAFVDNVIVATMRKSGVIVPSAAITKQIEEREQILSGSAEEIALRAKALAGVEAIVDSLHGALTSGELGNYLWGVLGKTPEYRQFERHATKDTVFY